MFGNFAALATFMPCSVIFMFCRAVATSLFRSSTNFSTWSIFIDTVDGSPPKAQLHNDAASTAMHMYFLLIFGVVVLYGDT
jgi:hypothetical protein